MDRSFSIIYHMKEYAKRSNCKTLIYLIFVSVFYHCRNHFELLVGIKTVS